MPDSLHIASKIANELTVLRRRLHQRPELGLDLPQTQAIVLEAIEELDLEIVCGPTSSSITAVLRGGATKAPVNSNRTRPAVLLRADMDALPIQEDTALTYESEIPGAMHACGHDLHTAGLIGAARILSSVRGSLAGDVVFMFQPGEETSGGANIMINDGVLDASGHRAIATYGLHVFASGAPFGVWTSRAGAALAACDTFKIIIEGAGGHGSEPHNARDPIPCGAEVVLALQSLVTRQFDVFDPVVVTVGKIYAGTQDNVISSTMHIEGTVRAFTEKNRKHAEEAIPRLAERIATAHGMSADVDYQRLFPPAYNDEREHEFVTKTIKDLFGESRYQGLTKPKTGSDDYAFVLNQVPGVYVNLSAKPPQAQDEIANHSSNVVFDDGVLPDAAALLAELAIRRLACSTSD